MDTIHNSVGFASLTTTFFSTMLRINSKKRWNQKIPRCFRFHFLRLLRKLAKSHEITYFQGLSAVTCFLVTPLLVTALLCLVTEGRPKWRPLRPFVRLFDLFNFAESKHFRVLIIQYLKRIKILCWFLSFYVYLIFLFLFVSIEYIRYSLTLRKFSNFIYAPNDIWT